MTCPFITDNEIPVGEFPSGQLVYLSGFMYYCGLQERFFQIGCIAMRALILETKVTYIIWLEIG